MFPTWTESGHAGSRNLHCNCCGVIPMQTGKVFLRDAEGVIVQARCYRHVNRNPCAIEGCKCTCSRMTNRYLTDIYLCSKHWRPLTDKRDRTLFGKIRSKIKRLTAQRVEETPDRELEARIANLWRLENKVWDRMVAKARSRAAGDVDMREINEMFGWED